MSPHFFEGPGKGEAGLEVGLRREQLLVEGPRHRAEARAEHAQGADLGSSDTAHHTQ